MELTVSDAWVQCKDQKQLASTDISEDAVAQTLTFSFAEELTVGPATFHVCFAAPLNGQMKGLYKSKYTRQV